MKKTPAQKQKIVIVVGPTASGKSALGVELSRALRGEIVSADSRQVYRGLDIGTGKITKREMRGVAHHLLDVASPRRAFSAASFAQKAHCAIADIAKRGMVPIVVGGTGFYIDVLAGRISPADVAPDPRLRQRLAAKTAAQLYMLLKQKDPLRAQKMDTPSERNNKARLIRALEVAANRRHTPKKQSEAAPYEAVWIGIMPSLVAVDQKIERRLAARLKQGMIAEAKRLHAGGLSYKRMEELGLEYRFLARLLRGDSSREEFEQQLSSAIRRYARKQIGYWKRNADIAWFEPEDFAAIKSYVAARLT